MLTRIIVPSRESNIKSNIYGILNFLYKKAKWLKNYRPFAFLNIFALKQPIYVWWTRIVDNKVNEIINNIWFDGICLSSRLSQSVNYT